VSPQTQAVALPTTPQIGVSVNVNNNIMSIHCLLVIGSILSNDFPRIIIIIGNVLGLRGLILLYRRWDGI
jgi:hypothetical protein